MKLQKTALAASFVALASGFSIKSRQALHAGGFAGAKTRSVRLFAKSSSRASTSTPPPPPPKTEVEFLDPTVRGAPRVLGIGAVWLGLVSYVALGAPGRDAASQALDQELVRPDK
jgi:hypothetical protein